jgi:hypothetical protein
MSEYNSTILAHVIGFILGGFILNYIVDDVNMSSIYTVALILGYLIRVFFETYQKKKDSNVKPSEREATRITFDGRAIKYSKLKHQHPSNIYWFNTVIHNRGRYFDTALIAELDKRFNSKILDYKPLKNFVGEINDLRRSGYLKTTKDGREIIIYKGEKVGEIE